MTISAERKEQNRKYKRNKKLKHYFATFFTFAIILWALIMMLPSKEIKTLNGKLINRSAISTGKYSGTHPRAFVELENGKKNNCYNPKKFYLRRKC